MPRYAELPDEMTPFGQLLIDYMWNKRPPNRPPLSPNQLAIKLGVPKQNTNNWLFRASLPPFETMMAVLAKLDIPLRDLYDAYKRAGILMPRWDEHDTALPAPSLADLPPTPRTRKATAVPTGANIPEKETEKDKAEAEAEATPAPRPSVPPQQTPSVPDEWAVMIAQTEATMRAEGAPEAMIAAVVKQIRNRQSGAPNRIQQHVIAEHSEPANDQPANDQTTTTKKQKTVESSK